MRQTLGPRPALIWRSFRLPLACALFLCLFTAARAESETSRRAAARTQFGRAEKQRTALLGKSQKGRTLDEYRGVVSAYRRVYLITPRAPEVPAALVAVAELYQAMGRQFSPRYYQSAIDAYQFLLHEYPRSRYREDALLTIGHIQQDDLEQPELAAKTFQQFLKLHPRSPKAPEAKEALARSERSREPAGRQRSADLLDSQQKLPQVTRIRTWNAENYTRIVIDVDEQIQYQAARISDPDRIYFDLHKAKLSSTLAAKTLEVQSGFLKAIRVAQNQAGVVRVVLDVDKVKDYSAFLLSNPYRLVVDVYGAPTLTANAAEPEKAARPVPRPENSEPAREKPMAPHKVASRPREAIRAPADRPNSEHAVKSVKKAETAELASPESAAEAEKPAEQPESGSSANRETARVKSTRAESASAEGPTRGMRPRDAAAALGPPPVPKPNKSGQHTLTRALGLKIGRIVIDPGHGGQDTGTIGATGLMEKDLCLDVALRLGKMIQQRLAGAEVIYTRDDDSFLPLEERTAIANQAKADLFVSIHANSSRNHKARGVETYYLNFSASSEAMEVASRENALSQGSIHELQDMIKKIARNEKIEESRELAGDIQDALTKRLQRINGNSKNRGVRKAPFVVLIGANMPSVLSEVSFLSNPADEQMLKKPEHRQRVADGLYHGMESYLQSINSLTYNQPKATLGTR